MSKTYTFQTKIALPETAIDLQQRIVDLFSIKEALEKEIGNLMGRRVDFEPGRPWNCVRCGHGWLSRLPHRPQKCPRCRAAKFDSQPQYTYERKEKWRENRPKEQPAPLPHSVMTRSLTLEDDLAAVTLTPPPALPSLSVGMSLREKLALMNATRPVYTQGAPQAEPEPVIVEAEEDLVVGENDAT
jgi:hypothetical protein